MKEWFIEKKDTIIGLGSSIAENIGTVLLFIGLIAAVVIVAVAAEKLIIKKTGEKRTQSLKVNRIAIIAMLSAIAIILNLFGFPLWFIPGFYKIDLSELPVVIGAFALGPVAGVTIEAVKILLNLMFNGTVTAFVGEIANFAMGCAFVVPAAIIYYARKNRGHAILGLIVGTVSVVIIGGLLNAFVLLPVYSKVFFHTEDLSTIIGMGTQKSTLVNSLQSFVLLLVVPFNLIKFGLVSLVTIFLYKPISHLLKK